MQVRNLLNAGDLIEPLPLGVFVTLEYADTGKLFKVHIGFDQESWRDSKTTFEYLLTNNKVPAHVDTHSGTAFIRGVLFTGKPYLDSVGSLPSCLEEEFLSNLVVGTDYNFFAGHALLTNQTFNNASQVRNWLQVNKFNVLPNYIVPAGDIEFSLRKILDITEFPYDHLLGFIGFDGGNCLIYSLNKRLSKIDGISTYLDQHGYVHSNISIQVNEELGKTIVVDYYDTVALQLFENSQIILDEGENIVCTYPKSIPYQGDVKFTCPVCGNIYTVEPGSAQCPNVHCTSRMYSDLEHFVSHLNLPQLDFQEFLDAIDSGKLQTFSDVLLLPDYADIDIEATLADYLAAIIPMGAVRDRNKIWSFYSQCNGSLDSVCYYMDHPERIAIDLTVDSPELVAWFSDAVNADTVKAILNYTNVRITEAAKRFEGSPIFRNKHIYLTGKFIHGTLAEVEAILRSYSATISDADSADCAIVGDIKEDISGHDIQKIRAANKPVFGELEFFQKYQIDEDLNQLV